MTEQERFANLLAADEAQRNAQNGEPRTASALKTELLQQRASTVRSLTCVVHDACGRVAFWVWGSEETAAGSGRAAARLAPDLRSRQALHEAGV